MMHNNAWDDKMASMYPIFALMHDFGIAFGVGGVTANLVLMMKSMLACMLPCKKGVENT